MSRPLAVVTALTLLCIPTLTFAQWIADGNPVSTAPDQQNYTRVIGDTQGGVIIAWTTNIQGGVNYDLFIERYDGFGQRLWSTGGVTVAATTNNQYRPTMVADGTGGVYIAWEDNRAGNYDIYAQHFDSGGNPLWGANGRVVCNDAALQGGAGQWNTYMVRSEVKDADLGGPGVIIAWGDGRNGAFDIYAQRMIETGAAWTANGVQVCGATDSQSDVEVVTDNEGGAIVVWRDARAGITEDDIYAQRVKYDGTMLWAADGVPVCNASYDQQKPRALADGNGGAYVTWVDRRNGFLSPFALYVQRVDSNGSPLWATNGVNVYGYVEYDNPELVSDQTGGVIVCWRDPRNGLIDIFAQRLTGNGTKRWGSLGETVTNRAGDDNNHFICPDGDGGLFAVWENATPNLETYIQHMDSTGSVTFAADGQLVCGATGNQSQPHVCVDSDDPAFVSWTDSRAGGNQPDVYLTRVYHDPTGVETPAATNALRVRAHPNPFTASTEIAIGAPGPGTVSVELFDVAGRRVARRTVVAGPGGNASLHFDGRGDDGRPLPSGVYLVRARTHGLAQTGKIVLMR